MKLFQRLLVAPAALGLLAPMTATNATEVNLNEISNYSKEEIGIDSNSFNKLSSTNPLLLAGGEGMSSDYSPDSFSDTTTASFSADFLIGAVDNHSSGEAVSAVYGYGIGLSTSFTGEDSFDVAIDAGSTQATLGEADLNSSVADELYVDGITYTFPVGDKLTVLVGDSTSGSALYNTACVYGGFTNTLDDCGNGASAFGSAATASTAISASYDIGGGWAAALGYAGEGSNTDGLMSKAGQDLFGGQVSYTADSYGVSFTYANVEATTHTSTSLNEYFADTIYYGINAYWTPEETGVVPSISIGIENGDVEANDSANTSQWFIGLQWDEAGPGTLGAAVGSNGALTDAQEDLSMYEVFYSYPLNDGMTITPAVFVQEQAGATEDLTGVMIKTSFSF